MRTNSYQWARNRFLSSAAPELVLFWHLDIQSIVYDFAQIRPLGAVEHKILRLLPPRSSGIPNSKYFYHSIENGQNRQFLELCGPRSSLNEGPMAHQIDNNYP